MKNKKHVSRFAHGATGLHGFPDAVRREEELANGLVQMAKALGSEIEKPAINSYGEFAITCVNGRTYGEEFAKRIKKHGARTGSIIYGYNAHIQAYNCWCYMNHFSVQIMLEEYFYA